MDLPLDFLERMKFLDDYGEFLKSYENQPETALRINKNKENAEELVRSILPTHENVPWCAEGFYIDKDIVSGSHPYHAAGLIYFQEPSAMCAAEMLPLEDGDFVLDLCAAPGGKTTQIAAVENITLVSNEIIPKRSAVLSENVERMGFANTVVTNESPENLAGKFNGFFDKIVIDAPCSGEGMFKKEPAAVQAWSAEHVSSCAERQKKIIDSAMEMLRQGGSIVYSTCTFSKEENEENIEYILEKYPYMEKVKCETLYPHRVRGEGHFSALVKDTRPNEPRKNEKIKHIVSADELKLYKEFEGKYLNVDLHGDFVSFGDNLYLIPYGVPTDGLKIKRAGLHLGECKKGRFEPSHALAKYLRKSEFKNYIDLPCDDLKIKKYLRGETLEGDFSGYGGVLCDGLPLGWVKGVGGILKNHLPKGLRLY